MELRARIRSRIRGELSAEPAVLVVDPVVGACWRWARVLREAFDEAPMTIHQATDAATALSCPLRDVWFAVVQASTPKMPELCQRIAERNQYVRTVVLAEELESGLRAPLLRHVDWLSVGPENWVLDIAGCARSTAVFRRHLVDALTESEVLSHVLCSHGPEGVAELGLWADTPRVPTAHQARAEVIRQALRQSTSKTEAAGLLGVGRSTLYRWMEKYEIDVPEEPEPIEDG